MQNIVIEKHNGILVVRDDKLIGGTKSEIVRRVCREDMHYAYASPVYGGFQIALAELLNERAHIFCAKRKELHPNTVACMKAGANIREVPHGYLSVVEKAAREFCETHFVEKIEFGAASHKDIITDRVRAAIKQIGHEPKQIWCAIGSGTLIEAILDATWKTEVHGVCVGKEYCKIHSRLHLHTYPKKFEYESKALCPFPSMANYDRKAWEILTGMQHQLDFDTMFWNVLG